MNDRDDTKLEAVESDTPKTEKESGKKGTELMSRRRAREAALQALYVCDSVGDCSTGHVDSFYAHFFPESIKNESGSLYENYLFSRKLVDGILSDIGAIDGHITAASSHWSVERMARVDRNILRVAMFELSRLPEIPVNVTIDEAIEISKRYGAPDSPTFINGVLDHAARDLNRKKAAA